MFCESAIERSSFSIVDFFLQNLKFLSNKIPCYRIAPIAALEASVVDADRSLKSFIFSQNYSWVKEKIQPDDTRRQSERMRELSVLAEKLGCSLTQLAIAWCLKNESVQSLLLGASTPEQLYDSIQSLQIVPKLNSNIITEIDRILENKPTRPPMVSTLALR